MSGQTYATRRRLTFGAVVLLVLVTGMTVRLIGIRHGAPDLIFHPDVSKQAALACAVFTGEKPLRKLFPSNYELTIYPYGSPVLTGRLHRLFGAAPSSATGRAAVLWEWAVRLRYFSVVVFLATVGLLLLTRRPRPGPVPALLTGLLIVLEPLNAQLSHYGMNDVPMVSLLLLAWMSAGAMERERAAVPAWSFSAGFLLGLAFGVKYQAILGGVFLLVGWWGLWCRKGWLGMLASVCAAAAGFAVGIWLTMPLLVQDPGYFFQELPKFLSWQANILGEKLPLAEKALRNLRIMIGSLMAPPAWILVCGIAAGFLRPAGGAGSSPEWRQRFSALLFCAGLGTTLVAGRDFMRPNDVLPLLAFMTVLFGDVLTAPPSGRGGKRLRELFMLGAMVAVAAFATVTVRDSLALARTDTRERARDWCRAHLPSSAVVLLERYSLPSGRPDITEIEVRHLSQKVIGRLPDGRLADHAVVNSFAHRRYLDRASPLFDESIAALYRDLEVEWEEVARFTDRELIHAQPEVRVVRRRNRS